VKKIDTGYTFDPHAGATYNFEHISLSAAQVKAQAAEDPHIVETINWTKSAGGDVHYNRYFAHDLDEALGLAVRLRFGLEELVEEIVAIRRATEAEAKGGRAAATHFLEAMPLAVSNIDAGRKQRSRKGGKK
jgi:hypothetical protein